MTLWLPVLLSLLSQAAPPAAKDGLMPDILRQTEESGRVPVLVPVVDDRIRIAPGIPPLLAFRYLEGRQRGRFAGLDLVLDDAGH